MKMLREIVSGKLGIEDGRWRILEEDESYGRNDGKC